MRLSLMVVTVALFTTIALAEKPKVVKTEPSNGANDVDASLKQLGIEFDQPMDHGGFSLVGGGEKFPKVIRQPRWVDDKTLVIAMKLEPNHQYELSVNSANFANFKNKNGESAVPYPITFKTGSAAAVTPSSTTTAADNNAAIATLRAAIDRDYSYRDRLKIDWAKQFREFTPTLADAKTPTDFAQQAAKMLEPARDIHLVLKAGDRYFATSQMTAAPNWSDQLLPKLVPGWAVTPPVATGKFDDGIAYILIATWSKSAAGGIERALPKIRDAKGLIIDVRPNAGGDEPLAMQFAGMFVDGPKVYSRNTIRHDGTDEGPYDRVLQPNRKIPPFRNKVVVLMGPRNVSTCESFLLMMKQTGRCTLVGETSHGSSGNPQPHDLGNGVTVLLPSWRDMLPDGSPLEGVGVKPDVEVKTTFSQLQKSDPVLDAGLKVLRGN